MKLRRLSQIRTAINIHSQVTPALARLVLTGREVANYLGHARASMTMDRYMSRHTVSDRAAELLVVGR